MTLPLEFTGTTIPVPAKIRRHPAVKEAQAVLKVLEPGKDIENGGVIGTANTGRAELYGWSNPVSPHMDSIKGEWLYAVIICPARFYKLWAIDPETAKRYSMRPSPGDVFRLNDRYPHWTEGWGNTVALFVGTYTDPDDEKAIKILERGIRRLALGSALPPRVPDTFRVPRTGECLAGPGLFHTPPKLMPQNLMKRLGWEPEICGKCDNHAVRLDDQWPYDTEMNRCIEHLNGVD